MGPGGISVANLPEILLIYTLCRMFHDDELYFAARVTRTLRLSEPCVPSVLPLSRPPNLQTPHSTQT